MRILAIIEPKFKLGNVGRKMFFADLVIAADDPALEQRPETLNRVGMDRADYVLAFGVSDDAMIEILAEEPIPGMFVGSDQPDVLCYRFADESVKGFRIGTWDDSRANTSATLDSTNDGNLSLGSFQGGLFPIPRMHVLRF